MLRSLKNVSSVFFVTGLLAGGTMLSTADLAVAKPGNGNGGPADHSAAASHFDGEAAAANQGQGAENNNGRGKLASVLKFRNAAHANQNGLENAAEGSVPRRLYVYQQTGGITFDEIVTFNELSAELSDLQALLAADAVEEIGLILDDEDSFDAALDIDENGQLDATDVGLYQSELAPYQDAYNALGALGGDSLSLTEDALDQLNNLLNL